MDIFNLKFWYASFIFLGFSISVGILVYLIFRDKKNRKIKEQEKEKEFWDKLKSEKEKGSVNTIKDLEKKFDKKG